MPREAAMVEDKPTRGASSPVVSFVFHSVPETKPKLGLKFVQF